MSDHENATDAPAPVENIQKGWHDLVLRVEQLEADRQALEAENKALRSLLETVIEHRQKSHGELVLLLTNLVSKLPLNDVGVIVARLVEHRSNVSQYLAALAKGTPDAALPQPDVLKTLDHAKRDLRAALKPLVDELVQLETPLDSQVLQSLSADPERFFAPSVVRAHRCFLKGQVPRERIVSEFGPEALACFADMTTDPKLNPRPKAEEIVLGFKNDFEALCQQQGGLTPAKRQELVGLYQKIQRSKAATEQARAQKTAFFKLSFLLDLLHFYEHQNTEAPDVIFAQRLPALVEQLALVGAQNTLDEKLIAQVEGLMAFVISPDHRQMIINNIGKGDGAGKTLKYVLRLRAEKAPDTDQIIPEFVRHLIPPQQKAPGPETLAAVLRLTHPTMQRLVLRSLMHTDRLRKEESAALGRATAAALGITNLDDLVKAPEALSPEKERQIAWAKIRELVARRSDAAVIAAAIRDRLHDKYNAEEIRESWIALTEAEPMSLIKVFCQLPFRSDGKTDPIARTVLETYISRLLHEKYAGTYHKVVNSLKGLFRARPDSPTLLNFIGLVKWASPEAAERISHDVGLTPPSA